MSSKRVEIDQIKSNNNKINKKLRHEMNIELQKEKKEKVNEMFSLVCEKYKLSPKGKYELRRLIGTRNISRLSAIYNAENYTDLIKHSWFKERYNNLSKNSINVIKSSVFSIFSK